MSLRRALTVAIALAAFSAAFLVVASCTAEGEGSRGAAA